MELINEIEAFDRREREKIEEREIKRGNFSIELEIAFEL